MSEEKTKFPIIYTIIILVAVLYGGFVISTNLNTRAERLKEISRNEEKISKLNEDIENLKNEISESDSAEFIERVARDEYGMVKPREIIYIDKDKKIQNNEN